MNFSSVEKIGKKKLGFGKLISTGAGGGGKAPDDVGEEMRPLPWPQTTL